MAFQISNYTVPTTGVALSYFTIGKIILNPVPGSLQIQVNGYPSAQAYQTNLQPANVQTFTINGAAYTAFLSGLTTADMPVGTPQGTLLQELIGALQVSMQALPFFATSTIVS